MTRPLSIPLSMAFAQAAPPLVPPSQPLAGGAQAPSPPCAQAPPSTSIGAASWVG